MKKSFWGTSIAIGLIVFSLFVDSSESSSTKDTIFAETPLKSYRRIELADVILLKDLSSVLLIDIRDPQLYEKGHIPNAKSITINQIKQMPDSLFQGLISMSNIILYDQSYESKEIIDFSDLLEKRNVKNINIYFPGMSEWNSCRLAIEK